MKAPRFTGWFGKLRLLNQPQRLRVLDALHPQPASSRSSR